MNQIKISQNQLTKEILFFEFPQPIPALCPLRQGEDIHYTY